MSQSFRAILPDVLPEVPNCPDLIATDHIKRATIRLCERAPVWRYNSDPFDAIANQPEYDLDLPDGAYLYHYETVKYNDVALTPHTRNSLDLNYPGWENSTGTPDKYYVSDVGQITLVPYPSANASGALVVRGILSPDRLLGTGIEDDVFQRYYDLIAMGAKGTLMAMVGAPWSNPQLAAVYITNFKIGVENALAASFSDHANIDLVARAPYPFV